MTETTIQVCEFKLCGHHMIIFNVKQQEINFCGASINYNLLWDHSNITSAKRLVGGVRKWQFLLIYSTFYTDIGGWA